MNLQLVIIFFLSTIGFVMGASVSTHVKGNVPFMDRRSRASSPQTYMDVAVSMADQLLREYDRKTGIFRNDYWQTPNKLAALADLYRLNKRYHRKQGNHHFHNSFKKAGQHHGYNNFLNDYLDDEGWWALAFLDIYDITYNMKYINLAEKLFHDMQSYSTPCGGIYWNKQKTYIAAIANELYIQIAAALANRVPSRQGREKYFKIASETYDWFFSIGFVYGEPDYWISDGLSYDETTGKCQPVSGPLTYNQGVILGAAAELYSYSGDERFIETAAKVADSTIAPGSKFIDENGVLVNDCDRNYDCNGDLAEFKGPFVSNLRKLYVQSPREHWKEFFITQMDSIINKAMLFEGDVCVAGQYWQGPFMEPGPIAQGIALDVFNAALTADVDKQQAFISRRRPAPEHL